MPSPRRRRAKAQKGKIVQSLKYQKMEQNYQIFIKKFFPRTMTLLTSLLAQTFFSCKGAAQHVHLSCVCVSISPWSKLIFFPVYTPLNPFTCIFDSC